MKYLFLFMMLLSGLITNGQATLWNLESSDVSYVSYANDDPGSNQYSTNPANGCKVELCLGSTDSTRRDIGSMTHIVAVFKCNGNRIDKVFQLGTYNGMTHGDSNSKVHTWYDAEHGDYYIVTCLKNSIISFRTLSTGNRTGLIAQDSPTLKRT